ncbi:MAG TPA: PEP/pyruvate-binding domain-containing protein, partial [Anaerolineales bacterium]
MAVLPFDSPNLTLDVAGGKGANLARLSRAGFPVPPGFIIATDEYRTYVADNGLAAGIRAAGFGVSASDAQTLDAASLMIRRLFAAGRMRPETADAIRRAYATLGEPPVAVRSSATAEDLPDLSFAGQQDTYLNVRGAEPLLKAVIQCWASLWTARAMGYRLHNAMDHAELALAIVVQKMVESETSGVLFTANPLTGSRRESVIDATFGLGEALVSGQVEPDHYVVDTPGGRILSRKVGGKGLAIRSRGGGGTESIRPEDPQRMALSDEQILQVAALGWRVQKEFEAPQDIEWAFQGEALTLLQSRPITSLYPLPVESFDPLKVWFSFGSVQGLLGPMTPLGLDSVRLVIAGAGRLFGLDLPYERLEVLRVAGERLWVQADGLIRNPLGARVVPGFFPMVEPSVGRILETLGRDPQLEAGKGRVRLSTVARLARFGLSMLPRFIWTMLQPERAIADTYAAFEDYTGQAGFSGSGDMVARLTEFVSFLRDRSVVRAFELIIPRFFPIMASSMGSLTLLTRLSGQAGAGDHGVAPLVLEVTRGVPDNVTTEMGLALWQTAKAIRTDPASLQRFQSASPADLARSYLEQGLPQPAQSAIEGFMARYGMRGIGEIDLGKPRWRERPEPIMQTLQSYLQITDEDLAPDVLFTRHTRLAVEAVDELAALARQQRGGWLKEKLVRIAARRV